MTTPELEPRTLWYKQEEDDQSKPVVLRFKFDPDQVVTFDDGHQLVSRAGHIEVESELFDWVSPTFSSSDHISLIYWLMKISDAYLSRTSRDCGISLYSMEPSDVVEPFDIFRY